MNATLITVAGNLTVDPQQRRTPTGILVADFRLASTERRREAGGEWRDVHTNFVKVTCWRSLGERVVTFLRKGDPVIVTGRAYVRSWEKPAGVWHTSVEIEASSIGPDLAKVGVEVLRRRAVEAPAPEVDDAVLDPFTGELTTVEPIASQPAA